MIVCDICGGAYSNKSKDVEILYVIKAKGKQTVLCEYCRWQESTKIKALEMASKYTYEKIKEKETQEETE